MKRIAFILLLALTLAALWMAERSKAEAPVSPNAFLYFSADGERELSRLPVALTRISDEEEIRIGNELARRYVTFYAPREESAETRAARAYVERVGQHVAARAHRKLPYSFHYIPDSNFINAFALPGGHVFIGGGLMALMGSEDELAAVLGHEIEHIDHYHCVERFHVEACLRKISLGELVDLPLAVFEMGYSKDQELEADREGTRLAVWGGYSPQGAIRMFEAFHRLYKEHVARAKSPQEELTRVDIETLEGYFRSHPAPSERIAQINRMIADEKWGNLKHERDLEVAYAFWNERAKRFLEAGHYDAAAGLAERSLTIKPDDPDALEILAHAEFARANFAQAARACRRFLDKSPADAGMARVYADALSALGDPQEAEKEFQRWIDERQPTALARQVRVDLAGLEIMSSQKTKANELILQAKGAAYSKDAPETLGRLGWWCYRAGDASAAVSLLTDGVQERPGDGELQMELGWAFIEQRNLKPAIQRFEASSLQEARMGIAVARWQARQQNEALMVFGSLTAAHPVWLNLRWTKALYSPTAAQSISEMQAEHEKRQNAARRK